MTNNSNTTVNIVGAGLAGLSAAIHLAMNGVPCRLISAQPSERAQSVLAEGGINGALNTMGENDSTQNHFQDTMKAGCDIADPEAVRDLTEHAPQVLLWLDALGVPFQRKKDVIQQRNFGGQKKKRTAYAQSSIGKVLMTALIDEARKYEAEGLIQRFYHHDFVQLIFGFPERAGNADQHAAEKICTGLVIQDHISGEFVTFAGPVLMASGGLNGLFPGKTTGTTANTGDAAAVLFAQGVAFSNLEMIQYHPTTLQIPDKRLLISEAARGEGGRLFVERGGSRWYFMEEKYPELGNLMPRDVVSREEYFVMQDPDCGDQVYLDCTGLSTEIWKKKLPDLRREVIYYTGLDPAKKPIPVEPGIHYFMGGMDTDAAHRTNIQGLYAAGECCSLYHGANRLGGNSTLGAVYGGARAAQTISEEMQHYEAVVSMSTTPQIRLPQEQEDRPEAGQKEDVQLGEILYEALGVVRDEQGMSAGAEKLNKMMAEARSTRTRQRCILGMAILASARYRKESRGALYRRDFPTRNDAYLGTVVAIYETACRQQDPFSGIHVYLNHQVVREESLK